MSDFTLPDHVAPALPIDEPFDAYLRVYDQDGNETSHMAVEGMPTALGVAVDGRSRRWAGALLAVNGQGALSLDVHSVEFLDRLIEVLQQLRDEAVYGGGIRDARELAGLAGIGGAR
jgi:hypothetical protein